MTSTPRKKIIWSVSIALGLVLLLGFIGPNISYKLVRNWICPISGSTRTQIIWFGYFGHEERTATALERWLKHKEPGFKPSWQPLSTQTYFLFGRSYGTAGTPEIYELEPILDRVVEKLSNERIAGLVAVLRHGSRDEQRQIMKSITDEVFKEN